MPIKKLIVGAAAAIICILAAWQFSKIFFSPESLTTEDATNKVLDLYKGEIVHVNELAEVYQISLQLETGTYEVEVDRETGDISQLTETKKVMVGSKNKTESEASHTPSSPPESNAQEPVDPSPQELSKPITEHKAVTIALNQVNGEVDDVETIELEGITYYLVEIKKGNEQEAKIEINSISGEVESITWDD